MKILAIETSCDETAIAFLEANGGLDRRDVLGLKSPKFKVLKSAISSQIAIHRPFGGVVPNLAKREHLRNLPIIFKKIIGRNFQFPPIASRVLDKVGTISNFQTDSKFQIPNSKFIDIVAVTVGPGLEPALWTGINFAKEIHKQYFPKAKLMGVNHLEGHIYSNVLKNIRIEFPAVALLVSGGHTILLLLKNLTTWKKLGETRDDAVGEVFDKVARMLDLPYPGGPEIEKAAKLGNPEAINFPRPMMRTKDYDFSFSGLKTSVLYYLKNQQGLSHEKTRSIFPARKLPLVPHPRSSALGGNHARSGSDTLFLETSLADIASSFQQAAVDVLVYKTMRAAKEYKAKSIMLSGGVAANQLLRKELGVRCQMLDIGFLAPAMEFNTDNAAMIGAAAYISSLKKQRGPLKLVAQANLNL